MNIRPKSMTTNLLANQLFGVPQVEHDDDPEPNPEGMVIGYNGRRRQGKSESMVAVAKLIKDYFGYPVLANFRLEFATGIDSERDSLRSGRFTLDEIMDFPEELEDCVICWDEIDRIFLGKRSTSTVSEFLENGLTQIGKRNIWLLWACQNTRRLNRDLVFQTDVLIECSTYDRGQTVMWDMEDVNGAWADPGTRVRKIFTTAGRVQGMYDTREYFDPLERKRVKWSL